MLHLWFGSGNGCDWRGDDVGIGIVAVAGLWNCGLVSGCKSRWGKCGRSILCWWLLDPRTSFRSRWMIELAIGNGTIGLKEANWWALCVIGDGGWDLAWGKYSIGPVQRRQWLVLAMLVGVILIAKWGEVLVLGLGQGLGETSVGIGCGLGHGEG